MAPTPIPRRLPGNHGDLGTQRAPELPSRSTRSQVTQDAPQVQFRVPGLEAVFQRGADLPLGLAATDSLAEQVGIAAEVLDGSERNRVDSPP